jgi:SAM-dependent methyltransferase
VKLPLFALKEIHLILKTGGCCILTCPFIWHIHEEPRIFFRYSRFGLQFLFEQSRPKTVELNVDSGFWVTLSQELVYYFHKFRKNILTRILISLLGRGIQRLGYVIELLDKDENFAINYLVVAQKRLGT